MSQRHMWEAVATLTGTIIGAGVLGIPYVFAQAGVLTGLVTLAILGVVVVLVNLCVGEVALRTREPHQLTGYAGIYLGPWGRRLMAVAMVVGGYGALMAYIIGEGQSLAQVFGGDPWAWSAAFFVVGAGIIYAGLRAVGLSELVLSALKFGSFAVVVALLVGSQSFDATRLAAFDATKLFVPYGVLLFALMGAIAIPEMRLELAKHPKDLKRAILIGSLVPILVYALFGVAVVGLTGATTTEIANVGIGQALGPFALIVANLFAILSMATAFIAIGLGLKEMYEFDWRWKPIGAFLAVVAVPVVLILAGVQSFITILGVTGALAGGLEGILLVLTYRKAANEGRRKPEYALDIPWIVVAVLVVIFIIGAALGMTQIL